MHQAFKVVILVLPFIFFAACFEKNADKTTVGSKLEYKIEKAYDQENVVPAVIIGSGPAGLSASIYIARAGMKAFVFAGPMPCGQLTQTSYVENWPGRERVLGLDLMGDIKKQAELFGVTIIYDNVSKIDFNTWPFEVKTEEGRTFKALSIVLATGATPRKLGVPGEQQYWGKGVTTCAVCDAGFFKDKEVVISGGGDSAVEMVFELAPYVKKVTMLIRKGTMKAASVMQKKLSAYPQAHIEYHKEITEIHGDGSKVTGIDVYDNQTKQKEYRPIDGVFLAIGHDPNNKMLQGGVALDEHGYVMVKGRSQETSVRGVFAAGEIQDPFYRQAIVAAGEGVRAALDAADFLHDVGYTLEAGVKFEERFFEHFADVKQDLLEISTTEEFNREVIKSKGIVVLDFYALNCPCCIQMIPHLEAVAHKMSGKIKILKANLPLVKKTMYRSMALDHNIQITKLPSLLVFKDGVLQDINTKVMNKSELYGYLQNFLNK